MIKLSSRTALLVGYAVFPVIAFIAFRSTGFPYWGAVGFMWLLILYGVFSFFVGKVHASAKVTKG